MTNLDDVNRNRYDFLSVLSVKSLVLDRPENIFITISKLIKHDIDLKVYL